MASLPYIAVIGGSYVGVNTAQSLATKFHGRFRVLLIEKNSHFQHLFAFPRFAVTTAVDTYKAFIPYTPGTFANCPPGSGIVVQAGVTRLDPSTIYLDRKVKLDGRHLDSVDYKFLVIATGTKLTPPSTLSGSEKLDGVTYLRKHAQKIEQASSIAIIGGGAVGVQLATDIMEIHPGKKVTLIHSRPTVMNRFHDDLDAIIKERCAELGVNLKLGSRVKLPTEGFPEDGQTFNVELQDGSRVSADFAIICTGQTPQSQILKALSPDSVNEQSFIRVRKTLQVYDPKLSHIFAVGDVADTGAHKAARPAAKQAPLVAENIEHILRDESLEDFVITDPPAIHMSLGITKNVVFGNPREGSTTPFVKHRDDGQLDMGIDAVWTRRGGGIDAHL